MKKRMLIAIGIIAALIIALTVVPACTAATPETVTVVETQVVTETSVVEVEVEEEQPLFAYVIHVPIPFTDSIRRGALNAAKDYDAKIDVVSPSKMDTMEQIALFDAEVAKGAVGIGVVCADASAWVVPIKNAIDQGIVVGCGNVYAEGSGAPIYAGISGYADGLALGDALLADPVAMALKGKVILGSCLPGLPVLDGRTNGVAEKMADRILTGKYQTCLTQVFLVKLPTHSGKQLTMLIQI